MFGLDAQFGDLTFRYYKNAQWLLIFYHNITGQVYFQNETEALNCHETQKYSILSIVNENMMYNNKYEFLLQYGASKTKYNRWVQDTNPIFQSENVTGAEGFDGIHLDYNSHNFTGLAKTSILSDNGCINSLLDGYFNNNKWYYGIGQYQPCDSSWSNNIPGDSKETEVYLWIRVLPLYGQVHASLSQTHNCFCNKLYLFTAIFL